MTHILVRASLLLTAVLGYAADLPPLMPAPWKITAAPGRLAIDAGFRVIGTGYSDARLQGAMARLEARIMRQGGFASVRPKTATVLAVDCKARGADEPTFGEDESYRLDVNSGGARLQANTVAGALAGMQTFAQLATADAAGFGAPAVQIEDHPRFPWRGLMMDVSRHWMPVEVVKRNLDAMAAVKLNVFHWHLADDQGFRVESKRYPRLQELGSDGHFYSQDEVRAVVAFARDRGIRVVPEFDIPGHTSSWFVGYPELASAPGPYTIERAWGIFEPTMDPSKEATYLFLDGFLGEMAALFPDRYFHIGGDEVEDKQWKASAAIQAFAREHNLANSAALQTYFNQRVQEILKKHGKTMVGWDEVFAPGLAADAVIQSWRGQASLAAAARQGYRGILSFGYYLDHLKPAAFHYAVDPLDGAARELNTDQSARVLGGEACMWDEYASFETVDSRIWPRALAVAERFWSPRETTSVPSMYARMEAVSRQLDWVGVTHRTNYQPMLDRLAGGRPADALRVLADASEALGIEGRRGARKYTSLVDLNRFVDAVRPESESVRLLEQAARTAPASGALRAALTAWAQNDGAVEALAETTAFVAELRTLSRNLAAVGATGIKALEYIENGKAAPQSWIAEQRRKLDAAAQPSAEVTLAAVRPVRILVDRAATAGTGTGN